MGRYRRFVYRGWVLGNLNGRAVAVNHSDGGRHRVRLPQGLTQREAEQAVDRLARQFDAGRPVAGAPTIAAIYAAYCRDREADGKRVAKQHVSWHALERHFGHLFPGDIDKPTCQAFAEARHRAGIQDGTIWTDLSCLSAALGFAVKAGLIAARPSIWKPRQPPAKDLHLTQDQARQLIEACGQPHLRLFTILGLATAARRSALIELTWDRVDLERGMIDLRDPARPVTSKRRGVVPVNPMARAALQDALRGATTDHVIEWGGRPVKSVRTGFARAAERAGLPWVTPHVLRHTAAVWMVSAGVPIEMVSEYLAHTSIATTWRVYGRFRPEALKEAAAAVNLDLRRRVG